MKTIRIIVSGEDCPKIRVSKRENRKKCLPFCFGKRKMTGRNGKHLYFKEQLEGGTKE